jgi:NADH-quinone oxidoreductase subunit L
MAWFDKVIIDGIIDGFAKLNVIVAHIVRWFDKYIIDGFVHLTVYTSGRIGHATRSVQSGNVQTYVLSAMAILIILLLWLAF